MKLDTRFGLARFRAHLLVALPLIVLIPTTLSAQDGSATRGLWLGAGLGVGAAEEGGAGLAFYGRLGATPSERLRAGVEVIGVTDRVVTSLNAAFSLLLHPAPSSDFFVKAGAGLAHASSSIAFSGGTLGGDTSESGIGLTLGAGYDISLGELLSLTPNADFLVQSLDGFADSTLFLLTVGLGLR